jgi:hypothetical protein
MRILFRAQYSYVAKVTLSTHLFILMQFSSRVTKLTGSSSDDWLYHHFCYNLS